MPQGPDKGKQRAASGRSLETTAIDGICLVYTSIGTSQNRLYNKDVLNKLFAQLSRYCFLYWVFPILVHMRGEEADTKHIPSIGL